MDIDPVHLIDPDHLILQYTHNRNTLIEICCPTLTGVNIVNNTKFTTDSSI